MEEQLNKQGIVYHGNVNTLDFPIVELGFNSVEFKPGRPEDGNTCGVRPYFDRPVMNRLWAPYRVWPTNPETGIPNPPNDGWIQWCLGIIVPIGAIQHAAVLQEFWGDQFGEPRIWTGAPILTQWRDWAYRAPWLEMMAYQPKEGDTIGFFLVAGDWRDPQYVGIQQRTRVIWVKLRTTGLSQDISEPEIITPGPTNPPVPPTLTVDPWAAIRQLQEQYEALREQNQILKDRVNITEESLSRRPTTQQVVDAITNYTGHIMPTQVAKLVPTHADLRRVDRTLRAPLVRIEPQQSPQK